MTISTVVEGFSVTHAQLLDGATAFVDALSLDQDAYDVYGVDQASLSPSVDTYTNTGDDDTLSDWSWLNYADLTIRAGYVPFELIGTLTGQTVSSSGAGASIEYGVDLWHEDDVDVSPTPALIRCLSRDKDGNVRRLDIGLYRVQWQPVTFDGPAYKDGLKLNLQGRCLRSAVDEEGSAFGDSKRRIGKLISAPTV